MNQTDTDGDGTGNVCDNCPALANPNQEDVDTNGIGDFCDPNTVYGTVSGADPVATITLYKLICGDPNPIGTKATNSEGYYAFGTAGNGNYTVVPDDSACIFEPLYYLFVIPQAEVQPYDFTCTSTP